MNEGDKLKSDTPPATPHGAGRKSSIFWYMVGLAVTGVLIGAMAGLSATPVIGTILPLLFGLLGGASGFYVAQVDLDTVAGRDRLSLMGRSLALLSATTLLGGFYGVSVRTGASPASFFRMRATQPKIEGAAVSNASEVVRVSTALELAALRFRLLRLGLNERDCERIVEAARQEGSKPASKQETMQILDLIRMKAQRANESFTQEIMNTLDEKQRASGAQLLSRIRFIQSHYRYLYDKASRDELSVSARDWGSRFRQDAAEFSRYLYDFDPERGAARWLPNHKELRDAMWDLELILLEGSYRMSRNDWMSGERIAESIDKLINTSAQSQQSSRTSGSDALRPSFAP